MDAETIDKLIDLFWSGKATVQDKKSLLEKISYPDAGWKQRLKEEYEESLSKGIIVDKKEEWFNTMLASLHQNIESSYPSQDEKPKHIFTFRSMVRWTAAAVLLITIGTGLYWYFSASTPKNTGAAVAMSEKQDQITREIREENITSVIKIIHLPDSTIVRMFGHSELAYNTAFGDQNRRIDLIKGTAQFKVAKMKLPFIVSAQGIITTDLGTVFNMSSLPDGKVTVKLIEGKINIHATAESGIAMHDLILRPGQQLAIDIPAQEIDSSAQKTVSAKSDLAISVDKAQVIEKNKKTVTAKLEFSQSPLDEVFNTLMQNYAVKIKFADKEMKDLWFTGTIEPGDKIETVISNICRMNDLTFSKDLQTFIIHKNK